MNEKLYNELAPYYDLFKFNDYKKQSNFVLNIIENSFAPNKEKKIKALDLACGTGEQIKILGKKINFDGLDINEGMLKMARKKNPKANVFKGDLNKLELKKSQYDLIICLSSSLQYILAPKTLEDSLKRIYLSLKPKGIFIFDLAYCKDNWIEGYVGVKTVVDGDLQIAEIFKSQSNDNISIYNPIYLIKNKGKLDFFIDNHEIYLYTVREIKNITTNIFRSVKIYADYSEKLFKFKKNQTPIFILRK